MSLVLLDINLNYFVVVRSTSLEPVIQTLKLVNPTKETPPTHINGRNSSHLGYKPSVFGP